MSTDAELLVCVERHNVNDDSVIILNLCFSSGEEIAAGDVILEVETSKTNLEVISPASGTLELHVAIGEEVEIGAPLFSVRSGEDQGGSISAPGQPRLRAVATAGGDAADSEQPADQQQSDALFSRAAEIRRQELGIGLEAFPGRKWVTVEDVESAAGLRTAPGTQAQPTPAKAAPAAVGDPVPAGGRTDFTRTTRTKRKRAESSSLTVYGNPLPQSTIWIDIDLPGPRVVAGPYLFEETIADLVVFEASRLFKNYPTLNAFHISDREYGVYDSINFGISFDSGENLKVLSIDGSDTLSLPEVQHRFEQLLHLYESGESLPQELMTSSTVTLSDLTRTPATGMLPLINGHQSLILGLSRSSRTLYSVSASFDHRVSEGLTVAAFLGQLAERVLSYFRDADLSASLRCFACQRTMAEELAMGNKAMLSVKRPDGSDALICRNCFEGW